MKSRFYFTTPLSRSRVYKGQVKIEGEYYMENCALHVEVDHVYYQYDGDGGDFILIPAPIIDFLDTGDRIGEIAYEHCKGLMPEPDMSHTVQTKGGLS